MSTLKPYIYSNRSQLSGNPNTQVTEQITLGASVSGVGYNWNFGGATVAYVSGSSITSTITITTMLSSSPVVASWRNGATVLDTYTIEYKNHSTATEYSAPQVIYQDVKLPYELNNIYVGVNDYGFDDVFNSSMSKLQTCFDYIVSKCDYLKHGSANISMRYGRTLDPALSPMGLQWQQADISKYPNLNVDNYYWGYADGLSATHIAVNSEYVLYVSNNTLKLVPTTGGYDPTVVERQYPVYSSSVFVDIIKIVLEETTNIIWVLEASGRLTQLKYEGGWVFLNSWNSTDGSETMLINPVSLTVDDDYVYIISEKSLADYTHELRIFDKNFKFISKSSYDKIPLIKTMCLTRDYIVMMNREVSGGSVEALYMIDKTSKELIKSVGLASFSVDFDPNTNTYIESPNFNGISPAQDPYFMFAWTKNLMFKFSQDGEIVGFGDKITSQRAFAGLNDDTYSIVGIAEDKYFNLYVASQYDIIRYLDVADSGTRLLSTLDYNLSESVWPLSELHVNAEECCSYMVYTRAFNRFYDNIVLLQNSITGKLKVQNDVVDVVGFKASEFPSLPYTKDEIYVGINELHCEAAVNRNIRRLYLCLQALVDLLNIKDGVVDQEIFQRGIAYLYWNGFIIFDGSHLFDAKRL